MSSENRTKSTRHSRVVFLGALVLIGAVALYNWIVEPHRNCLLAARKYESVTDNLVKRGLSIHDRIDSLRKELGELKERHRLINTRFFDETEAENFHDNLQARAGQSKCVVYSLSVLPEEPISSVNGALSGDRITARKARLSVLGECKNIATLLNQYQAGSKLVYIDSVRLGSDRKEPACVKCDMTITIYVIHRKEEQDNG